LNFSGLSKMCSKYEEKKNMRKDLLRYMRLFSFPTLLLVFVLSSNVFGGGSTITIVNLDGAGEGFNDPTPAAPVGGNPGTTLGEQRLFAFQHAANIWGATLDSSVPIRIQAAFNPLGPGVLGSAGNTGVFVRDFGGASGNDGFFPGAEFGATWYGSALADKRAGVDFNPTGNDINAQFSSNFNFYLGVDNNHGAQPDLVAVLLHEFGHGLNFQSFVNSGNGRNLGATNANPEGGFTDIYARHLVDSTTGLHWNEMTTAQRQASALKWGRLIWDGANVTAAVPNVLSLGSPEVTMTSPLAIQGTYQFGTAAFGPPIGSPNVVGNVLAAVDEIEPASPPSVPAAGTTTDGCSPFTNGAAMAGKIALIERGFCGFALKARNATNAGAIGVIIYNNVANAAAAPPGMGNDPPANNGAFVTIPTASLSRNDGLAIIAQLGTGVTTRIGVDLSIRAGANASNQARLFAPFPLQGGSSVSHYDSIAFKNLLMEPSINGDLTHNLKAPDDLTLELFRDLGWFADADLDGLPDATDCNANSNRSATIVIGGTDTGVTNTLFSNGCTISDVFATFAASAKNNGQFVSLVARFCGLLVTNGIITEAEKDAIVSAAARSKIP
jgi:hypothetical protein